MRKLEMSAKCLRYQYWNLRQFIAQKQSNRICSNKYKSKKEKMAAVNKVFDMMDKKEAYTGRREKISRA